MHKTPKMRRHSSWLRERLPGFLMLAFAAGAAAQTAEAPAVKPGDRWRIERRDTLTGLVVKDIELTVTAVSDTQIEANDAEGKTVWTRDLNVLETPEYRFEPAFGLLSFPLEVGKKWDFTLKYAGKHSMNNNGRNQYEVSVVGYEKITVRAGSFDAFKIVAKGYVNPDSGRSRAATRTYWYAPQARHIVKQTIEDPRNAVSSELLAVQLAP